MFEEILYQVIELRTKKGLEKNSIERPREAKESLSQLFNTGGRR